jgi:hypothetical protein
MPIINQAAAELAVRPFVPDFIHIVQSAWSDWLEGTIAAQMQHKRVRANIVWNQLIAHAKRRFDGRSGICVKTLAPWDGVLIGDGIFVRMKKADQKLLSRNYPTQSALAFVDQTQDLFGGIARLELVYLLDDSETSIERIVLVQRHKNSVAWLIDLLGQDPMAQNVFPFADAPDAGDSGGIAKRIIKPKRRINDEEQDVSNGGT